MNTFVKNHYLSRSLSKKSRERMAPVSRSVADDHSSESTNSFIKFIVATGATLAGLSYLRAYKDFISFPDFWVAAKKNNE